MQASAAAHLVLGLGETGLSVARYLLAQQQPFRVLDTRVEPPGAAVLKALAPDVPVHLGGWQDDWLATAEHLYLSPGLPLAEPRIQAAIARGVQLHNDIDLYVHNTSAKIIAVTGSNGKSTVVSLLEYLAQAIGLKALAGGNIGQPALNLLEQPHDWAILELSSFQLELVQSLRAEVAMILNITPDHLDRYPDMAAYTAAKQRIFLGAQAAVCHLNDATTEPVAPMTGPILQYALDQTAPHGLTLVQHDSNWHLMLGAETVFSWAQCPVVGRHNQLNALAALSAGYLCGWDLVAMAQALNGFQGLAHRCERVATVHGVTFINDSKGTNVGATLAALDGLLPECSGQFFLVLGGQDKGADFAPLWARCAQANLTVLAFGESAPTWQQQYPALQRFKTLEEAFAEVVSRVQSGDWVVLSPAGASFDQYSGYAARGNHFKQLVHTYQQTEVSS
jgi:UDP-N-acetylmuramoylalanine--D-glutamate ligase